MRERLGRIGVAVAGTLRGAADELFPPVVGPLPLDPQGQPWRPEEPGDYCVRCGTTIGPGGATPAGCADCVGRRFPWHRVTRLSAYEPPVSEWVRGMKFAGQWARAEWLGEQLAAQIGEPPDASRVVVCPVPMPMRRRMVRGYDQSWLMARALARTRGWPLIEPLRRRVWRRHTPQTRLSAPSKRPANVRGAFVLRRRATLAGADVVLVDDVKTSGATLRVCARLLRQAGARTVHVAVAAVADPERPTRQPRTARVNP